MPNPCINDGFCAEDKANEKGYMCICKQGFTGNRCHSKFRRGGNLTYLNLTAMLNWEYAAQSDPAVAKRYFKGERGLKKKTRVVVSLTIRFCFTVFLCEVVSI